jgi:predicted PP-loop superfamily ATPase
MSDSDNDSYVSEHDDNDENNEESIIPINGEYDEKPIKPKRIMSEKQLENLKKARLIAFAKLKEKKKETELMKKKQQELKILKKLEKNITLDKKLKEVKKKLIIDKDEKEYIKKKKPKKKIVYVSDSDSNDEVIYKMKPKRKVKPIVEEIVDDITREEEHNNKMNDKIVEQHYNDKIASIKKEYLMKSIFQR